MSGAISGGRGVNRELLIESLVIMVLATILFAITFSFDHVPAIFAQGIQPTIFPRAILIIIFGLAALQAWKAVNLSAEAVAGLKPSKPVPAVVFVTAGATLAFLILMPTIGTFPTLVLFCPALALIWGERRRVLMALSFTGFTGFIYVLFRMIMNVPLP